MKIIINVPQSPLSNDTLLRLGLSCSNVVAVINRLIPDYSSSYKYKAITIPNGAFSDIESILAIENVIHFFAINPHFAIEFLDWLRTTDNITADMKLNYFNQHNPTR